MGKIVAAFLASHTALMIRAFHAAPKEQAGKVMDGFQEVRKRLRGAAPDALMVIGTDHFKTFFLDDMPTFCIGLGPECEAWGEGGVPKYKVKVHQELGHLLLAAGIEAGFDLSFSLEMPLDHAFMCPLHFVMPEMDIPIIPVFQNCYAPPLPTAKRCYQLGGMIERVVGKGAKRVALLGTGGLSHTVPILIANQVRPESDLEQRMLDFMLHGERWDRVEAERLMISQVDRFAAERKGRINERFDRRVLDLIRQNRDNDLLELTYDDIEKEGGNGAQELRNWFTVLGAVPERKAEVLTYEPVQQWLTGVGIVALNPRQ